MTKERRPGVGEVLDEREWKAKFLHQDWRKRSPDIHSPEFHLSPFKVAPPRLPDGRTFCPKCSLFMVPWAELPEQGRDFWRAKSDRHTAAQNEWELSGGRATVPSL